MHIILNVQVNEESLMESNVLQLYYRLLYFLVKNLSLSPFLSLQRISPAEVDQEESSRPCPQHLSCDHSLQ